MDELNVIADRFHPSDIYANKTELLTQPGGIRVYDLPNQDLVADGEDGHCSATGLGSVRSTDISKYRTNVVFFYEPLKICERSRVSTIFWLETITIRHTQELTELVGET